MKKTLSRPVFLKYELCPSADLSTILRLNGDQNMLSICADVQCDKDTSRYRVRVKGASDFVDCPPGTTLVLSDYSGEFKSGAIECAPYEDICPKSLYPDDDRDNNNDEIISATSDTPNITF
ncbi:unnamed protein product [Phytomonas sp. Hart1]|nr:unnamed protein product [Phytomonas sp. Hart1]|eukprot:CCW69203.1 unnamed protein product [Phytomonas sp. isolate Hart1]